MLQQIMLGTVTGRILLSLALAGILVHMITVFSYKRMKKAAKNAGKTKKQWVTTLKKKFDNYERFGRIRHAESFIEHYFSKRRILGVTLGVWEKAMLFLSVLSALTGAGGSFYAFIQGQETQVVLIYLFSGGIGGLGLLLLFVMGGLKEKRRQVIISLTDYLTNGAVHRYETDFMKEERLSSEEESFEEAAVTEEEKQVLRDVLEDYFW